MRHNMAGRVKRILMRGCVAAAIGGTALALSGAPAVADVGQGSGLQSATVVCGAFGTVTLTAPPAHAITPVAFIDGSVWLTETETISGPRGTFTQDYGIPTDGRPTTNCSVTFGRITVTWTAVQVA